MSDASMAHRGPSLFNKPVLSASGPPTRDDLISGQSALKPSAADKKELAARRANRERRESFEKTEWIEVDVARPSAGVMKRFAGGSSVMVARQGSQYCVTWSAPNHDAYCPLDGLFPNEDAARCDADRVLAFMRAFMEGAQ